MNLKSHETNLVGAFVFDGERIVADAIESRIRYLIAHSLEKVAISPDTGAWETLFRDPSDGRLWERTYPQSERHGGGPMRLVNVPVKDAVAKYRIDTN